MGLRPPFTSRAPVAFYWQSLPFLLFCVLGLLHTEAGLLPLGIYNALAPALRLSLSPAWELTAPPSYRGEVFFVAEQLLGSSAAAAAPLK